MDHYFQINMKFWDKKNPPPPLIILIGVVFIYYWMKLLGYLEY